MKSIKINLLVLTLLTLAEETMRAQCTAYYTLSQTKGCAPFTLSVDGLGLSSCTGISYLINNTTFSGLRVLSVPGVYNIRVTTSGCTNPGCVAGSGNTLPTQTVTVLSAPIAQVQVSGCGDRIATVRTDSLHYDTYIIDWRDGATSTVGRGTITQHQYATPGVKEISIRYFYNYTASGSASVLTCNGGNATILRVITVVSTLTPPRINKLIVNGFGSSGNALLSVSAPSDFKYSILEKQGLSGTFVPIDTVDNGDQDVVIGNVQPQKCYQIRSFDACGNFIDSGVDVCALSLSAQPTSSNNQIRFETHPSASEARYTVSVNGNTFYTVQTTTGIYFSRGNTTDNAVACQQIYCYRHTASFGASSHPIESVSPSVCIEALKPSTFTGLNDVNSSFESQKIVLFWKASTTPGVTYIVYNSEGTGNFVRADSTNQNKSIPSNQNSPCYGVAQKDKCGTGPIRETCPMRLNGQKISMVQNSMQSNAYKSGNNHLVSAYEVEMYTAEGQFIERRPISGTSFDHIPINEDHQKVQYRFKATVPTSDGVSTLVYSNFVEIKQDLRLWVPNAFTPNGDGLNDTWFPKGLFFDKYNVQVYSRWGQLVFSSTDKNAQWDGGELNPGIYQYFVEVETKYGDKMSDKGTVHLIR